MMIPGILFGKGVVVIANSTIEKIQATENRKMNFGIQFILLLTSRRCYSVLYSVYQTVTLYGGLFEYRNPYLNIYVLLEQGILLEQETLLEQGITSKSNQRRVAEAIPVLLGASYPCTHYATLFAEGRRVLGLYIIEKGLRGGYCTH